MIDKVGQVTEKLFHQKAVNFILEPRYCQKCAKKAWKNEDKTQSFTMLPGVCERCHKGGLVAYIERRAPDPAEDEHLESDYDERQGGGWDLDAEDYDGCSDVEDGRWDE